MARADSLSYASTTALSAARAGADIALNGFGRIRHRDWKPDGTVVSAADLPSEIAVHRVLAQNDPGRPVVGEETYTGSDLPDDYWLVDPIDGTENYLAGIPVWATMVVRVTAGTPDVAAVVAPALSTVWTAARGRGAFRNGSPIRVSGTTQIADAQICYGGLHEYAAVDRVPLVELCSRFRLSWGWGNFWGHMLVAEGSCDVALSLGTHLWDVLAPSLIVEQAGGWCSDLTGSKVSGSSIVSSNGLLHESVVATTGRFLDAR